MDHVALKTGLIMLSESGCVSYQARLNYLNQGLAGQNIAQAFAEAITASHCSEVFQKWQAQYPLDYYQEQYAQRQIQCVTILDDAYSPQLREIHQPPLVLFVQGQVAWLKQPSLAVVGARNGTPYGRQMLAQLLPPLAGQVGIVSGLARGIDSWSHQCALAHSLATIGVIGTGLAHTYPAENATLQSDMATNACVVSALPLHAGVKRWQFPFRNEIIAGLTLGTLVIEAAKASGSLITANYALQYNREVMAVPGRVTDPYSSGCNALIQAGALAVLTAKDIQNDLIYLLKGTIC